MHKKKFKIGFYLILIIGFLFLLEGLYFRSILRNDDRVEKADVIVVFGGESGRVSAGCKLIKSGYAPNLIISPADDRRLLRYRKKYGLPPEANVINEELARTTFENALYCSKLIKQNQFKSVILVTSNYHMPRSYLLMKILLTGSGAKITFSPVESSLYRSKAKKYKIVYNEMIRTWGSLFEMIWCNVHGQVPEMPLKSHKSVRWLKSVFLFDM